MPAAERVCRKCRRVVTSNVCDNCGSSDLASRFRGLVIILDPRHSRLSTVLEVEKAGAYAIKIG